MVEHWQFLVLLTLLCIVLCYFTYEKRMSEKLGVYEREREERRREGERAIFILESSTEGGVVTTG